MSTLRLSVAALLAFALLASDATAAELEFGEVPALDSGLDLSIPESPALFALGLSPESVSRPASPRALAADLLSGLDANGNFQAGLALDTVPYLLIRGDRLTISEYRTNPNGFSPVRLASRTQLSAATTKGTDSDDPSVRAALGVRTVPFDLGDPRLHRDLDGCFTRALKLPAFNKDDTFEEWARKRTELQKLESDYTVKLQAAAKECRDEDRAKFWNASAWELGAAPTWIQEEGTSGSTQWDGASFWSSASYGFEQVPSLRETSQLIFGVTYRLDEHAPNPEMDGDFMLQDTLVLGPRLRIGSPALPISLEGSYLHRSVKDGPDQDGYRFSLGAEIPLPIRENDDVWLQVSVGGTGGLGDDDRLFLLATVKWGENELDLTRIAKLAQSEITARMKTPPPGSDQ